MSGGFLGQGNVHGGSVGVYMHIPFCLTRCTYCDFYSVPASESVAHSGSCGTAGAGAGSYDLSAEVHAYLGALYRQIDVAAAGISREAQVPTLYIGGGTPSVLGANLSSLVAHAVDRFTLTDGAEVTVELNPDDVCEDLIQDLVCAGVNRFSLGVQSFDDAVLARFGRRHDAQTARAALTVLQQTGLPFSLDLIAGVPGVGDSAWADTVREALSFQPHHVSVYALSIEEHTPLAYMVDAGMEEYPDPDQGAEQLIVASELLASAGLARYEVSNYAIPGFESRHNTSYWTGVPYLGFGPAAASMLNQPDGSRTRFFLHDSIESFIAQPLPDQPVELEGLTGVEAAREDAMLGLRLASGISQSLVERAGVTSIVEELVQQGLLASDSESGRIRPTERGWLLGNEVFEAVLLG